MKGKGDTASFSGRLGALGTDYGKCVAGYHIEITCLFGQQEAWAGCCLLLTPLGSCPIDGIWVLKVAVLSLHRRADRHQDSFSSIFPFSPKSRLWVEGGNQPLRYGAPMSLHQWPWTAAFKTSAPTHLFTAFITNHTPLCCYCELNILGWFHWRDKGGHCLGEFPSSRFSAMITSWSANLISSLLEHAIYASLVVKWGHAGQWNEADLQDPLRPSQAGCYGNLRSYVLAMLHGRITQELPFIIALWLKPPAGPRWLGFYINQKQVLIVKAQILGFSS